LEQNIFSLKISEIALKPIKKIKMLKQYQYILSATSVNVKRHQQHQNPKKHALIGQIVKLIKIVLEDGASTQEWERTFVSAMIQ
jgi:hypothetical protein